MMLQGKSMTSDQYICGVSTEIKLKKTLFKIILSILLPNLIIEDIQKLSTDWHTHSQLLNADFSRTFHFCMPARLLQVLD